jgi:hypothetical protein
MADFTTSLSPKQKKFISEQPVFFVATCPKEGRINLSPKGMTDTFAVISDTCVSYLDFVGSGNETAAHILNDGRLTIMMMSFTRNPNIFRMYGKGHFAIKGSDEFNIYKDLFPDLPGVRQIIFLDIESIQDSCGYGVPLMELTAERDTLTKYSESKGEDEIEAYKRKKNITSIDGLPTGILGE